MKKQKCTFLNLDGSVLHPTRGSETYHLIDSNYLGQYKISVEAVQWINKYKSNKKISALNLPQGLINCAYAILRANDLNVMPVISGPIEFEQIQKLSNSFTLPEASQAHQSFNVKDLVAEKVVHTDKINALLMQLAANLEDQQAFSRFSPSIQNMVRAKIAGIVELGIFLDHFCQEKFLKGSMLNDFASAFAPEEDAPPFSNKYEFTIHGLNQVQVEKGKTNTNKVFIATPFSWPEDEPLRQKAMETIKKVCTELGWKADIVTQSHTDNISDRILSDIKSSRFVIAELTYHNKGVYFESGYARGLGKNVFHLVRNGHHQNSKDVEESKRMHFDIQQVQYRRWEDATDLYTQLKDWIYSTVGEYKEF